jgi:hypothetical protein
MESVAGDTTLNAFFQHCAFLENSVDNSQSVTTSLRNMNGGSASCHTHLPRIPPNLILMCCCVFCAGALYLLSDGMVGNSVLELVMIDCAVSANSAVAIGSDSCGGNYDGGMISTESPALFRDSIEFLQVPSTRLQPHTRSVALS